MLVRSLPRAVTRLLLWNARHQKPSILAKPVKRREEIFDMPAQCS
jgi:hypothetical protein